MLNLHYAKLIPFSLMASKTTLLFLLVSLPFFCHLHFSSAQNVQAAYWFRDSEFPLSSIDSTLFTHLFCAFADLDNQTNQLVISQSNQDSFSQFTATVQQKNPSVKTLLSIGGGRAIRADYSSMASQPESRKTFIDSSIRVARSFGFHGLDLDWEYPQTFLDMANFGNLIDEWRSAVVAESSSSGEPPLILSAAVYYAPRVNGLDYPIQSIVRSFDWINLMAYDFYGPTWSNFTNAPAALYDPTGQVSGSYGIGAWIQAGLPSEKLVLGIPFYGYAWQLVDPNVHGLLAPASGPVGSEDGSIGYNQIREFIVQSQAVTVFNASIVTDYCYSGTTWIGYDDYQSVTTKVSYAKSQGLLGYFAWHVGVDYGWILSQAASQTWNSSPSVLVEEM